MFARLRLPALAMLIPFTACTSGPRYDVGDLDLSALTAEQDMQMAALNTLQARVDAAFLPLVRSGVGICDETAPYYGFRYETSDLFEEGLQRQIAGGCGAPSRRRDPPDRRDAGDGARGGGARDGAACVILPGRADRPDTLHDDRPRREPHSASHALCRPAGVQHRDRAGHSARDDLPVPRSCRGRWRQRLRRRHQRRGQRVREALLALAATSGGRGRNGLGRGRPS